MKRKRYWLFAGDHYYPNGGMMDYHSSHDTLEEAKEAGKGWDWAHVLDSWSEESETNTQQGVTDV